MALVEPIPGEVQLPRHKAPEVFFRVCHDAESAMGTGSQGGALPKKMQAVNEWLALQRERIAWASGAVPEVIQKDYGLA
jgi:hypothetical protein